MLYLWLFILFLAIFRRKYFFLFQIHASQANMSECPSIFLQQSIISNWLPLAFGFLSGPFYERWDRPRFPGTFLLQHIVPTLGVDISSPNHSCLHQPPILYRIFPF